MKRLKVFNQYKGKAKARKAQVASIPNVYNYQTLLYIGASLARFELIDEFYYAGYEIDVLEIFEPNVKSLEVMNRRWKIFKNVMLGDVRKVEEILKSQYDVIVFWHGPEHLGKLEIAPTLRKLEDFARRLLICGCPWGDYPQGPVKGNVHEEHVSSLDPWFFKDLGFNTSTVRRSPGRGSNLLAWKKIKD